MCFEFGRFVGFFSRWGWKGRKREDSRQKMGVRERGTVSGQFLTSSFLKGPRVAVAVVVVVIRRERETERVEVEVEVEFFSPFAEQRSTSLFPLSSFSFFSLGGERIPLSLSLFREMMLSRAPGLCRRVTAARGK